LSNTGRNNQSKPYSGLPKLVVLRPRRAVTLNSHSLASMRKIACKAYVDESHHESCNYDMIIGRDIMHSLGINLLFDTAEISRDNAKINMQHPELLRDNWVDALEQEILYAHDPDTMDAERIQGIIESKYTPGDLSKIVEEYAHLEQAERRQLLHLLQKYEDLLDGSIGTWKTEPTQLELKDPNVKPYHAKPCPVPAHSQEKRLKDEIRQLCGSLRSLADLREVNKVIKRKPFPLPKITKMLQKLEGFMYATSLDLKMGYHHMLLTPFSSRLCTIVLPWGKYEYCRLPMGLSIIPDVLQENMSELMSGLEFAWAYLDDLLILSTEKGFEKHLDKLELVLTRLQEAGLKINAVKSFFAQINLEYLGYNISRESLGPTQRPAFLAAIVQGLSRNGFVVSSRTEKWGMSDVTR
jgi:hypothetical protein